MVGHWDPIRGLCSRLRELHRVWVFAPPSVSGCHGACRHARSIHDDDPEQDLTFSPWLILLCCPCYRYGMGGVRDTSSRIRRRPNCWDCALRFWRCRWWRCQTSGSRIPLDRVQWSLPLRNNRSHLWCVSLVCAHWIPHDSTTILAPHAGLGHAPSPQGWRCALRYCAVPWRALGIPIDRLVAFSRCLVQTQLYCRIDAFIASPLGVSCGRNS